jgi:hypothetical protein
MRTILITVFLLFGLSAQAAVINFEEFAPVDRFTPVGVDTLNVEPGFVLNKSGSGFLLWDSTVGSGNESSDVQIIAQDGSAVSFSQVSGSAFDLVSFDMLFIAGNTDADMLLRGERGDGSVIELQILGSDSDGEVWETVPLSGQLTNLTSITFTNFSRPVQLDNIVLQAVPVPAAVWLFGSALAGLGWIRRKQIV